MLHVAVVALAGALGTLGRYGIVELCKAKLGEGFPWGTLIVNLVGSALLGLVMGLLERGAIVSRDTATILGVGFLGGFTTFSSFSVDTIRLLEGPSRVLGTVYVAVTIVVGVACAFGGLAIARAVAR